VLSPTNLFKRELLDIFKFTKKITLRLYTGSYIRYRISLWSLLSMIRKSSLEQIILELGKQSDYDDLLLIYPISSELKSAYNEANYNLSDLIQGTGMDGEEVWCQISYK